MKHLVISVSLKRLSSLFTLISTVYLVNGTVARNRKSSYLCSAYQKSLADKLNMLYLSGFCHSMIYPIQYSESDWVEDRVISFILFLEVKVEETAKYTTHTKTLNASGTHGKSAGFNRRRHEKGGCYNPKAATLKHV